MSPWPRQRAVPILGAIMSISKSQKEEIESLEQSKTALPDDWFHLPL